MAEPNSLDPTPVAPQPQPQPQLVQGGATSSLFGGSTSDLLQNLSKEMPEAYEKAAAAKRASIAEIDRAAKKREATDLKTAEDEQRESDKIINSRDTTLHTKIPAAPSPQFRDPFEGGGSMLMFLGAVASLGARRPLTTAMGAMGSYLEGFQAGDKERIDLEWKRYKAALEQSDREMDKEIAGINYGLKKDGMSLAARNAYFTAQFAASGNKYAADVLKAKGLEGLGDLSLDMWKAKTKLAEFVFRQEETHAMQMMRMGFSGGPNGNDAVHNVASMIANYQQAPPTGYSMKSPFNQQVMAEVQRLNPSYRAGEYTAINHAIDRFDTGKQGDTVRSLNVAIQHLSLLKELGAAVSGGDVQRINALKNRFKEELGFDAPTNFDLAKEIVGDELVKAVVGGAAALGDREAIKKNISRNSSWSQLSGAIDTAQGLMGGQLTGLRQQYVSVFPRDARDAAKTMFEDKLLPDTIRQLEGHAGTVSEPKAQRVEEKIVEGIVYWRDGEGNWHTGED